jgi:hypothetical protein
VVIRHTGRKPKTIAMKEYLMLFKCDPPQVEDQRSPEEMKAVLQQWQTWIKGIADEGKFSGTNRLESEGKLVKPGNIITDGPYAESKEMIGGYLVVKADSIDEAAEMAKGCPGLLYGFTVEVRTVLPMDGDFSSNDFLFPKAS